MFETLRLCATCVGGLAAANLGAAGLYLLYSSVGVGLLCLGLLVWRKKSAPGQSESPEPTETTSAKTAPTDTASPEIDRRPLGEFYPDMVVRHAIRVTFTNRWLPREVFASPVDWVRSTIADDDTARGVLQECWRRMERGMGVLPEVGASRFASTRKPHWVADLDLWSARTDKHPAVCIELPAPERPTQAFFIGIVLIVPLDPADSWPQSAPARIFTLERTQDSASQMGVLCELENSNRHRSHGTVLSATREEFVQAIGQLLQA